MRPGRSIRARFPVEQSIQIRLCGVPKSGDREVCALATENPRDPLHTIYAKLPRVLRFSARNGSPMSDLRGPRSAAREFGAGAGGVRKTALERECAAASTLSFFAS